MTSQLNVDTIVDKAGSGGTNVKIGNTSTYVSDGGAVTQNAVQGVAKVWIHVANDQSINDSLNISSLDDDAQGDYGININNDFSNATWAFTFGHDDQAHATIILSTEISQGTQTAGAVDIEQIYVNSSINRTHYDGVFAMTCHGDLA